MAFSACGRFLVTASTDNTLFFFACEGKNFTPIGFVETPSKVNYISWSPNAATKALIVACDDGAIVEVIAPEVGYILMMMVMCTDAQSIRHM